MVTSESLSTFHSEIASIKQKPDGGLSAYFHRALSLLGQIGGRDWSETGHVLSLIETYTLDSVIYNWVRGLCDMDIRREILRSLPADGPANDGEDSRENVGNGLP